MTTFIICQRCGKPMRPVFSDGTDVPTQGFCSCPPATGWGEALLRQPSILLDWRDAELARLRAENTVLRDTLVKANELHEKTIAGSAENERAWTAALASAERDKYAAALVEIRGICTAMMDGWGQTVTVLDKIRKITLAAIKRQPTEPPHRPETFA